MLNRYVEFKDFTFIDTIDTGSFILNIAFYVGCIGLAFLVSYWAERYS